MCRPGSLGGTVVLMLPSRSWLLRVCVRACLRACVRSCVRACVLACLRACVLACLRACLHMRTGAVFSSRCACSTPPPQTNHMHPPVCWPFWQVCVAHRRVLYNAPPLGGKRRTPLGPWTAWDAARCHLPFPLPPPIPSPEAVGQPHRSWWVSGSRALLRAPQASPGASHSRQPKEHTVALLPPRPPPPVAQRAGSKDQAAPEPIDATEPTEPTSRRTESTEPQVEQEAKTSTVALSSDPTERARQLELLRSYGYDTSAF